MQVPLAKREGLTNDIIRFEVASSTNFPGPTNSTDHSDGNDGYDLITFFDCFHDMSDPYAVARHVKNMLKPDGTCMNVLSPNPCDLYLAIALS